MPKRSNVIPQGPLYRIGRRCTYDAFTLGPDPEFVFTIFACVGLNAVKILRAINHRVSVQMCNPRYPIPVTGKPEFVCLSNVLMKQYHMEKFVKYRELKVLTELGFIEEKKRKNWNSSRIVKVSENVIQHSDILKNPDKQKEIRGAAIKIRKQTRPRYEKEQQGSVTKKKVYNKKTKIWETASTTWA